MVKSVDFAARARREAEVLALLARKGRMDIVGVADALGWDYTSARKTLERMRTSTPKRVYRCGYVTAQMRKADGGKALGGRARHFYAAGDAPDAPIPPKYTNAERQRRYRERMSAEQKDFHKARDRARHWRPKRDPFTAIFFGSVSGD